MLLSELSFFCPMQYGNLCYKLVMIYERLNWIKISGNWMKMWKFHLSFSFDLFLSVTTSLKDQSWIKFLSPIKHTARTHIVSHAHHTYTSTSLCRTVFQLIKQQNWNKLKTYVMRAWNLSFSIIINLFLNL